MCSRIQRFTTRLTPDIVRGRQSNGLLQSTGGLPSGRRLRKNPPPSGVPLSPVFLIHTADNDSPRSGGMDKPVVAHINADMRDLVSLRPEKDEVAKSKMTIRDFPSHFVLLMHRARQLNLVKLLEDFAGKQ